jgi:predicted SprT family Zn-dependent metalloprotease
MTQTALTDEVWTTAAADESATAASDETNEKDDDPEYPQTKQVFCERAEAHAADVAAEHFPELPVESIAWETSTRMQRSAGKAIYDRQSEEITIRLSWDAYETYGWEQFARIVRHELIHAWQYHEHGEADHGPTFRQWVEPLETDRHCERYAEPKYWVVCEECESRDLRYRRSKVVKQTEKYSCGRCGGDISIETP